MIIRKSTKKIPFDDFMRASKRSLNEIVLDGRELILSILLAVFNTFKNLKAFKIRKIRRILKDVIKVSDPET